MTKGGARPIQRGRLQNRAPMDEGHSRGTVVPGSFCFTVCCTPAGVAAGRPNNPEKRYRGLLRAEGADNGDDAGGRGSSARWTLRRAPDSAIPTAIMENCYRETTYSPNLAMDVSVLVSLVIFWISDRRRSASSRGSSAASSVGVEERRRRTGCRRGSSSTTTRTWWRGCCKRARLLPFPLTRSAAAEEQRGEVVTERGIHGGMTTDDDGGRGAGGARRRLRQGQGPPPRGSNWAPVPGAISRGAQFVGSFVRKGPSHSPGLGDRQRGGEPAQTGSFLSVPCFPRPLGFPAR